MKQIQLTQGQFALVDDEDYEELSKYKWYAQYDRGPKSFYAARSSNRTNGSQSTIRMHRYIMRLCGHDLTGMVIDHINHNTLDNRKENLRVCTQYENCMNKDTNKVKLSANSSGYKGVRLNQKKGTRKGAPVTYTYWESFIHYKGKRIYLGNFKTKEEAHEAYCKACVKYYGEFTQLA